jgi:hypothetical protein
MKKWEYAKTSYLVLYPIDESLYYNLLLGVS